MEKLLCGGCWILPRCRRHIAVDERAGVGSGVAGQFREGGGFFPRRAKCGWIAVVVAEFSPRNESRDGLGVYDFECGAAGGCMAVWLSGRLEIGCGFLSAGWRGRDVFFPEALEWL